MCGSMALVELPHRLQGAATSAAAKTLQDALFARNIEVPVKAVAGKLYVRVSCAAYNTASDFEHLAEGVAGLEV